MRAPSKDTPSSILVQLSCIAYQFLIDGRLVGLGSPAFNPRIPSIPPARARRRETEKNLRTAAPNPYPFGLAGWPPIGSKCRRRDPAVSTTALR